MPDFTEQATEFVDLIRSQNWKNGGVLSIDRTEAIDLINQALRTAYASGAEDGTRSMGGRMMEAFDAAMKSGT